MFDTKGQCTLCKNKTEVEHLNLYVNGSEGIYVCLQCKLVLTKVAQGLQYAGREGFNNGLQLNSNKNK